MALNQKALALAAQMNKKNPGSIVVASEMVTPPRFPSGSLSLDVSLGGGWPANKWIEAVGLESHGKTALTLKTVAANQQVNPDHTTLWVAGEPYDTDQAAALGVDNSRVVLLPSMDLEVVYDTVLDYIAERAADLVVIDSYPALIAPDEGEKTIGDSPEIAQGARMTGKFFRKMGAAGLRNPKDPGDCPWLGIFINQWRDVIGWQPTGSPGITPGGKAKNYAFYQRVEVKRTEFIKDRYPPKNAQEEKKAGSGYDVGQIMKVKPFKNKGGPPRREAYIEFYFDDAPKMGIKRGEFDTAKEAAIMGVLLNVIQRNSPGGSYYGFGEFKWKGMLTMLNAMREDPDLVRQVSEAVMFRAANPVEDIEWGDEELDEIVAEEEKPQRQLGRRKS